MKKLANLVMAMVLALSLSMTVMAADTTINPETEPKTGSTNITYDVAPAYTVTIPESVELNGSSVTVKAEGVKVAKGSQVVVKLTGTSGTGNAFKVRTDEGAELTYTVKKVGSETALAIDDTVLEVNPEYGVGGNGAAGETALTFVLDDPIQYAGNYAGFVTFTISVDAIPVTP